jgi:hypothetical protein
LKYESRTSVLLSKFVQKFLPWFEKQLEIEITGNCIQNKGKISNRINFFSLQKRSKFIWLMRMIIIWS